VTRTCEDGVLGPVEEGHCDLDQQANGVCTFGFYCLEVCGPLVGTVTVPAGETRIVQRGNLPRNCGRCVASPAGGSGRRSGFTS
jgi:hypothetical protein